MKTVTGRVISAEPISLSKADTILSGFVSSETETSQDVSAYLRRASAAFTELRSFHREIKSTKPKSEARHERNLTEEFEELGRAKGIDDSVENGEKIRSRESETVTGEESVHGREQEEKKKKKKKSKENKEDVVEEKLEDEQRDKERKKNKGENVIDEKVDVKLEEEQWSEERKESKNEKKKKKKKKKKSKKTKEEDLIDEKVNVKVEEEQRSEETKEKKKRKSDGEIGSEERNSKKKRRSKEIEG